MPRSGGADHFPRHFGVGHHRRCFGDLVTDLVVLLDVLEVHLAEEIPHRSARRDDVGLIATVCDHVMRALLRSKLLAAKIPADVHQLYGAERVASRHGRAAACADSPSNVYSTEIMPVPVGWPHEVEKSSLTWVKSTASTSLNMPARTKKALPPKSSSATPGQTTSVPESLSRSISSFTASAATMLTDCPELWPSPWPGAPSTSGSR